MKKCPRCSKNLPLEEFSRKASKLQPYCRGCNKEYHKEHYQKNKSDYIARNKRMKSEISEFVRKLKESTPCADCGNKFHFSAMDFDHLRDKSFDISRRLNRSLRVVVEEIKKCELVCSNCHRVRTYNRSKSS